MENYCSVETYIKDAGYEFDLTLLEQGPVVTLHGEDDKFWVPQLNS
jgi:hypothetical protein